MNESAPACGPASRPWSWICAGAAGMVVLAAGLRTVSTPSLWSALAAGREILAGGLPRTDTLTFTSAAQPWIDVRWLYDLLILLAWKAGGSGLIVLAKTAAVAAALYMAARTALRHASPAAAAAACILLTAALAPRLDAVPAVFAMPLAAGMFAVLFQRPRPARDFAILVPLQIAWINLDVTGVLGPVIAAACATALWMEHRRGEVPAVPLAHLRARTALVAALAAACLASPYGVAHLGFLAAHASEFFGGRDAALLPALPGFYAAPPTQALLTGVLVLCAIGLVAPRQTLPTHLLAMAAVAMAILFKTPQAVPLFAVLVLPFLAFSLQQVASAAERMLRGAMGRPRGLPPATALVAVILCAAWSIAVIPGHVRRAGVMSRFGLGAEDVHLAPGAASALARPGAPARVLCLPADGSHLAWLLPGRAVFCDLREGLRTAEFSAAIGRFLSGDAAAQSALLQRWSIDGIVLNSLVHGAAQAAQRLMSGGGWSLAYVDGVTVILLPAGREWPGDGSLRREGLDLLRADAASYEDALRAGRRTPPPARILGAGIAFAAFGHPREAASAFELLLRGDPSMTPLHLHLGLSDLAAGRQVEAAESLQRLVARHPGSPQGWAALADALRMGGRTNDAEVAARKAEALRSR